MSDTTCAICGRPVADQAYVDVSCTAKTGAHLRAIIELAPAARLVAAGLVRRGNGGGGSNKPGSRSPGDDGAMDTMDAVVNSLSTIAREIADTRGLQTPRDGHTLADPLSVACSWLLGQMEWARHASDDQGGAYAVAVFDEIGESARRIRRLVDGPAAQKYLGPCGAERQCEGLDPEDWPESDCGDHTPHATHDLPACEGDVYARVGAQEGRCRTCGIKVSTAERTVWLHEQARSSDLAWTARNIADALSLNVKTLRAWATDRYSGGVLIRQAKLSTYWRDGERLVPWVEPPAGVSRERLHYVADVVELVKQAAEQRAENARRDVLVAG